MVSDPAQDVREPCLGIDIIELGGIDERVDRGGAPPFFGSSKAPVAPADGYGAYLAFGGIVGHAEPTVVEEARERSPSFEAVVDGLAVSLLDESLARC